MDSLNFWLHMDEQYMWRWYCFDANRRKPIGEEDAHSQQYLW